MSTDQSDPRARELGLSVRLEPHAEEFRLTATVIYKVTEVDDDRDAEVGSFIAPNFSDHRFHDAAAYDGLKITGAYKARHYYSAQYAYQAPQPIDNERANAIARVLRGIGYGLSCLEHEGNPPLSPYDYPALVLRIAQTLEISYFEHQLVPGVPPMAADAHQMLEAFHELTPCDPGDPPAPF